MKALTRFLLDAFYITCFFVVTLGLATGADALVGVLTRLKIDGDVVEMVRWLARGLAAMDVIGVGIAGIVSLWRFIRALMKDASKDGEEE